MQEWTERLKQSFRQKGHVVSTSGTSSLQEGEASSSPTGWEGIDHDAEQQRLNPLLHLQFSS
jgi:hypothetical protein